MTASPEAVRVAINRGIGKKLGRVMEARGMTRADLAQAVGISDARMARILKGSSELTAPELVLCARALCASPNHLTI